ncbi:MAG: phosphatidate cytidylyltransferase [Draconibacterium sp.]|nr:phosphatidate cytidylyltransferase [Draconibacterium sp.]
MIQTIYIIILSYFILGSIGFFFINRKKEREVARKSRTKFITYFFIINILFFSIVINPILFQYLSILIIGFGFFEIIKLFINSGASKKGFFTVSVLIFGALSTGFLFFGKLDKELILFTFLILSIFDSFSQISGQLWGRKKIAPKISPNKTVGGIIGGAIIAIISSVLLNELYPAPLFKTVLFATGIILFAFAGDIAASFFKRKYGVKDYSNLIPGHGGFLDRFDSLIAGGAWVALSLYLLNF